MTKPSLGLLTTAILACFTLATTYQVAPEVAQTKRAHSIPEDALVALEHRNELFRVGRVASFNKAVQDQV